MATTVTIPEPTPVPAAETSFNEIIATFPFTPNTDEGRGFLPIIIRSMGHILYLVGRYDDTAKSKPTQAKAKEEVDGAISHWNTLVIDDSFSTKTKGEINTITQALTLASEQIPDWSVEDSLSNLQKLANRMVQLTANLDREVLGIRESDAGLSL